MMRTLAVDPTRAVAIDRSRYVTVLDLDTLDHVLAAVRTARRFAIDLETTSIDPHRADPVGVSLAVAGHDAVYIPLTHRYLGVPKQLDKATVLERLRPLLADPGIAKVGQNLKYDAIVLARAGVPLVNIADDAMLAAWVLDSSRASYSLDSLAREVLGHETIHYEDVTGKGKNQRGFDEVELAPATAYAAEDADVALRLCDALAAKVHEAHLDGLYRELELPLVPVLIDMERAGLGIDLQALATLGKELTHRLHEVEARAHAMIGGEPVNLASPKQLAELFFVKLGYPTAKKTKTGFSTDQEVLETLAETYELPRVVLEYRLLAKLKSTYVESLPKMVNPETGRVHTSFHQTGTATGRLSSSDPNLQNIPIRSDEGKRIRAAFVAAQGCELVSADYSQVELRVMAHLSGDPDFIEAFRRGEDIHTRTAQEILTGGTTPDAEARRRAKAINFGILYGLSEFGLARQLGIPRGEAAAYIKAYFGRYPRIRTFLDETIERARTDGFVSTLAGRRRFLPDLNSHNRNLRQAAERVAMNTPIQGSAADLIKMAMLRVHRALAKEHPEARLVLQVHDELIVEAPNRAVEGVRALLVREMSGVMTLEVPLLVEAGHGRSWAQAH